MELEKVFFSTGRPNTVLRPNLWTLEAYQFVGLQILQVSVNLVDH